LCLVFMSVSREPSKNTGLSEEKHETVGKLEVRGWRLEAIWKVEEVGGWRRETVCKVQEDGGLAEDRKSLRLPLLNLNLNLLFWSLKKRPFLTAHG
jgi:hypothetical protein